jgi:hypothetical protein
MDFTGIICSTIVFVFSPIVVFTFIYFNIEGRRDIERRKLAKEMLELEIKKEELHLHLIEAENEKLDHMIEDQVNISKET